MTIKNFFREPIRIAAAIIVAAAALLFLSASFSEAAMQSPQQITPTTWCGTYEQPVDIEGYLNFLKSADFIEVVDIVTPFRGFDGMADYLVHNKGKIQHNIFRWKDGVYCEQMVEVINNKPEQGA